VTGTLITNGAQISGARSPRLLDSVQWRLIFVGFQCGTRFMSFVWKLELLSWITDFWKICAPLRFKVPLIVHVRENTSYIKLDVLFFCNILGDFTFS
jgi:hypothetical protein